jgi:hypothetical protein
MGTGVTLAIRPPGNWKSKFDSRNMAKNFDEQLKEVGKPQIPHESNAMWKGCLIFLTHPSYPDGQTR